MTQLEQLQMELNMITWQIGQAESEEERIEKEVTYNSRISEILLEIETIESI
jgi:hypothetical protein